jgi:hypothetical protein
VKTYAINSLLLLLAASTPGYCKITAVITGVITPQALTLVSWPEARIGEVHLSVSINGETRRYPCDRAAYASTIPKQRLPTDSLCVFETNTNIRSLRVEFFAPGFEKRSRNIVTVSVQAGINIYNLGRVALTPFPSPEITQIVQGLGTSRSLIVDVFFHNPTLTETFVKRLTIKVRFSHEPAPANDKRCKVDAGVGGLLPDTSPPVNQASITPTDIYEIQDLITLTAATEVAQTATGTFRELTSDKSTTVEANGVVHSYVCSSSGDIELALPTALLVPVGFASIRVILPVQFRVKSTSNRLAVSALSSPTAEALDEISFSLETTVENALPIVAKYDIKKGVMVPVTCAKRDEPLRPVGLLVEDLRELSACR